jgi:hypothetical protein
VPNASRRALPTASASGTHNRSQAFRRGAAGAGAPDAHEKGRARRPTTRCHSASCRTLGAHWHTTATRIAARILAVPFELLSSFSTTIEDVSASQI